MRSTSPDWENGIGNATNLVGANIVTHPYFVIPATLETNPQKLQQETGFPTLCSRHFDSLEQQQEGKFLLVNPVSSPQKNITKLMQAGVSREMIDEAMIGSTPFELHGMIEIFSYPENKVLNYHVKNRFGLNETIVDFSYDFGIKIRLGKIYSHVKEIFEKMNAKMVNPDLNVTHLSWRADY